MARIVSAVAGAFLATAVPMLRLIPGEHSLDGLAIRWRLKAGHAVHISDASASARNRGSLQSCLGERSEIRGNGVHGGR
jgi:hypothetical protein